MNSSTTSRSSATTAAPAPAANPRDRSTTPNQTSSSAAPSMGGSPQQSGGGRGSSGLVSSTTAAATVPASLSDPALQPCEGEEESHLITTFLSLSARRPKPTAEKARGILKKAYWVIDWALCIEKLDLAEEKHAALTTRFQSASEASTTNLKHLKFIQNNLYAQLEESKLLSSKLSDAEQNGMRLATEAQQLRQEASQLRDTNAQLKSSLEAKDEELIQLKAELKDQKEKMALISKQKSFGVTAGTVVSGDADAEAKGKIGSSEEGESGGSGSAAALAVAEANCAKLNARLGEELQRYKKQLKELDEYKKKIEKDCERKVAEEVETMLRQLQEYYRMGAAAANR